MGQRYHVTAKTARSVQEIIKYIRENKIYSYAELVDSFIDNGNDIGFTFLINPSVAYTIKLYIESLRSSAECQNHTKDGD